MLKNIGMTELTIISLIIIVVFGAQKIPEFVRGIGEAIREFKKASK